MAFTVAALPVVGTSVNSFAQTTKQYTLIHSPCPNIIIFGLGWGCALGRNHNPRRSLSLVKMFQPCLEHFDSVFPVPLFAQR